MSRNSKPSSIGRPLLFPYFLLVGALYYWLVPNLNPSYGAGVLTWFITLAGLYLASSPIEMGNRTARRASATVPPLAVVFLAFAAFSLTMALFSHPMFHSSAYFELLGEEKTAEFSAALPPLDLTQAPLVSDDMAQRAAEKKLSEVPALGSQVELGHMTKQLVRGKLYWVAFLHHRGFFKWWSEGSTPGYVMVSAHDSADVSLVTELNGKPLKMKYLSSAYFGQNLYRHLWFGGYAFTGLTDFTPEIDEEGRPFYVATRYTDKIGFGGSDATGVVVIDVQTGETTDYPTSSVPAWVDRVQPEDFIHEQVDNRLNYVHGWWNPSDKDKQAVSGDINLVYGNDGKAYYFVGITSVAKEGGLTSFMLIDTHSKMVTRFTLPGVTEFVAQRAAEGVMPEKRYSATNALPFMVHGEPSYVMALRDGTGLARAYAVVNMRSFNIVATGETLQAAIRLYQQKLSMDRTQTEAQTPVQATTEELVVRRIASEVRSGSTVYFLTAKDKPNLVLMGNSELSEKLVLTQPGDSIVVEYKRGNTLIAPMTRFENKSIE